MIRYFTAIDKSPDNIFVYVGTTGGDVLVFRRDTGAYSFFKSSVTGNLYAFFLYSIVHMYDMFSTSKVFSELAFLSVPMVFAQ